MEMVTIENGKSGSENIQERKETARVQAQIKEELKGLTQNIEDNIKDSFYEKNDNEVTYNMDLVKQYLTSLKGKSWKELQEKNASAWVMAVQIALESQNYDVGVIDGIFKTKGKNTSQTMEAVKKFQKEYNEKHKNDQNFQALTVDGLPGPKTIQALLDGMGGQTLENKGATPGEKPVDPKPEELENSVASGGNLEGNIKGNSGRVEPGYEGPLFYGKETPQYPNPEKTEGKAEEKTEEKVEEKAEEKVEEITEEKTNQKENQGQGGLDGFAGSLNR